MSEEIKEWIVTGTINMRIPVNIILSAIDDYHAACFASSIYYQLLKGEIIDEELYAEERIK
jgi:hypothetical protein